MSNESESQRTTKRAYQKPELTQVALKAEEAVLGTCKTSSSTSGPGHSSSQGGCTAIPACSSAGS